MKHKHNTFYLLLAISVLLNIWLFAGSHLDQGYSNSRQSNDGNRRYLSEYDPYIADARQRWSSINQFSDNPFRNRTTSVVTLNDQICVSFEYSQPDIGGPPPYYCYSFDGVELISKRDDVE